jgi:hypothetical protein
MGDQLHDQAALPARERDPGTHGIGGLVGTRVGLDDVKRIKHCLYQDAQEYEYGINFHVFYNFATFSNLQVTHQPT